VEPNVAYGDSASQRHTEGLDPAIQILVVNRVLIVPDAKRWIGHLVGNEPASIHTRLGLDRIDGRARPHVDGRRRAHRRPNRHKGKTRRARDIEATVRGIVIHVALP
jgi:hypothetical protein